MSGGGKYIGAVLRAWHCRGAYQAEWQSREPEQRHRAERQCRGNGNGRAENRKIAPLLNLTPTTRARPSAMLVLPQMYPIHPISKHSRLPPPPAKIFSVPTPRTNSRARVCGGTAQCMCQVKLPHRTSNLERRRVLAERCLQKMRLLAKWRASTSPF